MKKSISLYISLRYIRGQTLDNFSRFVSWLSTIGITIGVMALIIVLSVMNGFEHEIENKILRFTPQAILTSHEGYLNPKKILSKVPKALHGVSYVTTITTSNVILQSSRNMTIGVMLGVNPKNFEPLFHYLSNCRIEQLIAGQYRVILGEQLAKQLSVQRGDYLRLIVPSISQLTPLGNIPSKCLFTVVGTYTTNSEVDNYQCLVNEKDSSRLMNYPIDCVTGWRLWFKYPLKINRFSHQNLPNGIIWKDWREQKGELFNAVHMEKNIVGLLLSLIIVVAIFNIITSLTLLIKERESEVAILQTQGLKCYQIMLIFMIQGASFGIIGSFLGAILGMFFSSQINRFISVIGNILDGAILPVHIQLSQIIYIVFLSIILSLISTIYPAFRIMMINPTEILRYE